MPPYKEDQVFLKTQQEPVQLTAKASMSAGPGCPAQTSCTAGALPCSQAELTCAARLKDNLGHGEDIRETECFCQSSILCNKQITLTRSGTKLLQSLACSDVGFLHKHLRNRKFAVSLLLFWIHNPKLSALEYVHLMFFP